MSIEGYNIEERGRQLANVIFPTIVANGYGEEFLKLLDSHITHTAYEMPKVVMHPELLAYMTGEINFVKGLRDGVVNALEAQRSQAND